MIIPEAKGYNHSDENLLPMINIVFLLLIFFMVAGAITAADRFSVTPPESSDGTKTTAENELILLDKLGQLAIGQDVITLDELVQRAALSVDDEDAPLLQIKTDAETPSAELFKVLQALNAAGIKKVRLLATSK